MLIFELNRQTNKHLPSGRLQKPRLYQIRPNVKATTPTTNQPNNNTGIHKLNLLHCESCKIIQDGFLNNKKKIVPAKIVTVQYTILGVFLPRHRFIPLVIFFLF